MNDIKDMTSKSEPKKKPMTIKLPRISGLGMQSIILVLLIVVAALQTIQLFGLEFSISNANVKPSISAPASGGSGGAKLPTMVGGC